MRSEHPAGSVQGLCSAGATCFAVCSAFLGYWGFQQSESWRSEHFFVLLPLAMGGLAFILTPFFATSRRDRSEALARIVFVAGAVLTWMAICAAVILSLHGISRPLS